VKRVAVRKELGNGCKHSGKNCHMNFKEPNRLLITLVRVKDNIAHSPPARPGNPEVRAIFNTN